MSIVISLRVLPCVVSMLLAVVIGYGQPQPETFNFDSDVTGKVPTGFTSYATGGGPPGKWLVTAMSDAPSGKHVVMQTDADTTDARFPVLIANTSDYTNLDVSVK